MSDLQFNLTNVARSTAILLGLTAASFGVTFILNPIVAAESFGLPQSNVQKQDTAFLRVLGGRNLAIGLMGIVLAYQRDFKAVGSVLLCLIIPGTLDSVIIWRQGVRRAAWGHIVGTAVFLVLGTFLASGKGD